MVSLFHHYPLRNPYRIQSAMKKNYSLIFLIACALAFFVSLTSQQVQGQSWTPKPTQMTSGVGGYYEYLPVGYDGVKKFPLLVFLHGLGEQGNGTTDLGKVATVGLPRVINSGQFPSVFTVGGQNFSFIVIAPQFVGWPTADQVNNIINYAVANYSVDPDRIYLTGLSMGGGGTWDHASSSAARASRLAAIVPVCGASGANSSGIQTMVNAQLPVLATHNADDGIVSVSNTNGWVDGMNAKSPIVPAVKVIWPSGGHNAWSATYDPNNKIYAGLNCFEWMLQYKRGSMVPVALSATISGSTQVNCNGGSNGTATVSANGGTAPYTYSWSTSPAQTTATASNLAAGSYTVTVRDAAGATATASVTITQPSKLNLTVTPGTIPAYGGSTTVAVSASGGTAPYTYSGPTTNVKAGTYTYTVTDAKGCTDSKTITLTEPAPTPVAVSVSSWKDVTCNGAANGSVDITVTGGKAPFTYSWNTTPVQTTASASNLPAGSYTVTVRDANNTVASVTANISQPAVLNLNVSAGTISVYGGTTNVTVGASGGTAPYTYSGPTTNVAAGTYTYTVTDAKGCTASRTITITQPAPSSPILLALGKQDVSCNGGTNGTATVTPSGGTAPYTYSWSTSPAQTTATASNLRAGTYTVTVRDANNTVATNTVTIGEPGMLSLNVTAGSITAPGGTTTVTLSAGGGTAPYSFAGPVTAVTAGTYTYTVTDAKGCTDLKTLTLTDPSPTSPLTIVSLSHTDITCAGAGNGRASVSVTGGKAPYAYSWSTSTPQASANASGLAAGSYTVTVRDAAGATVTGTVTIVEPSPISLQASANTITKIGGTTNVTLQGVGGTAPYAYTGNTNGLKKGNYTFQVKDANGCGTSATVEVKEPGVELSAFTLSTIDTATVVKWNTGYEFAIDRFEIEKAKDDKTFFSIASTPSKGSGLVNREYNKTDIGLITGSNTYRLYAITQFGEKVYLGEKKLYFNDRGSVTIKNLVNRIDVTVTSGREEKVTIAVFDILGRPVSQTIQQKNSNVLRISIPMDNLRNGIYVVKVSTAGGMQSVKQVVKQ